MRLHHPLWTHLPALGLLVYAAAVVARAWPLPDRVPVHFSLGGQPDRWGSPWEVLLATFGLMAGFIALSVFMDEKWARQETRKTFNWLGLLDELYVGFLTALMTTWVDLVQQPSPVWAMPWTAVALCSGSAMAAAAVLELLRPCRPDTRPIRAEDTGELQSQVALRLRDGQSWVYWESQNPLYICLLSLALFLIGAATSLAVVISSGSWFPGVLMFLLVPVGLMFYGGLRVEFSRGMLSVRLGVLGVRLLRLNLGDIAVAEVQAFRPLQEFGGWGLRYGWPEWSRREGRRRGVWAFFFRGARGVKVVRRDGRTYLIGSDHPERLCAGSENGSRLFRDKPSLTTFTTRRTCRLLAAWCLGGSGGRGRRLDRRSGLDGRRRRGRLGLPRGLGLLDQGRGGIQPVLLRRFPVGGERLAGGLRLGGNPVAGLGDVGLQIGRHLLQVGQPHKVISPFQYIILQPHGLLNQPESLADALDGGLEGPDIVLAPGGLVLGGGDLGGQRRQFRRGLGLDGGQFRLGLADGVLDARQFLVRGILLFAQFGEGLLVILLLQARLGQALGGLAPPFGGIGVDGGGALEFALDRRAIGLQFLFQRFLLARGRQLRIEDLLEFGLAGLGGLQLGQGRGPRRVILGLQRRQVLLGGFQAGPRRLVGGNQFVDLRRTAW